MHLYRCSLAYTLAKEDEHYFNSECLCVIKYRRAMVPFTLDLVFIVFSLPRFFHFFFSLSRDSMSFPIKSISNTRTRAAPRPRPLGLFLAPFFWFSPGLEGFFKNVQKLISIDFQCAYYFTVKNTIFIPFLDLKTRNCVFKIYFLCVLFTSFAFLK